MPSRALVVVLFGAASAGCITTNSAPVSTCFPPAFGSYAPSDAIHHIASGAGDPPSSADPLYVITANGAGAYRLAWTDPLGGATCFTGLVTIASPFATPPVAVAGHEDIVSNGGNQVAFASIPGATFEGVDFAAGTSVVDVEVFVDGVTTTGIYYTDASTRLSASTSFNVAAFQFP